MGKWILPLIVMACNAEAATDRLRCYGRFTEVLDGEIKRSLSVPLKVAGKDPDFLAGQIENYKFHVDAYYLREDGVGLMITKKADPITQYSVVGFKSVPGSPVRVASSKRIEALTNGGQIIAETQCIH